jgi:hypothetical protein
MKEARIVSVSGNFCAVTFGGISSIKGVPVIGDASLLSVGDVVRIEEVNNRPVALVPGTKGYDVSRFVNAAGGESGFVVHPMSYHTDEETWFDTMFDTYIGYIILFSSAVSVYAATNAGMAAAIGAASSGDTILVPPCILTSNFTVPAGVTVTGRSIEDVVFTGQITLSNGSTLELLTILRSKDQAGAAYGIVEGTGAITATAKNIRVSVQNAGGPAYALYMANGGTIRITDSELLAEVGTDGYAAYIASGTLYQYGGRALGTTALYPYYM